MRGEDFMHRLVQRAQAMAALHGEHGIGRASKITHGELA